MKLTLADLAKHPFEFLNHPIIDVFELLANHNEPSIRIFIGEPKGIMMAFIVGSPEKLAECDRALDAVKEQPSTPVDSATRPTGIKAWIEVTKHLFEALDSLSDPENKIIIAKQGPELDDLQAAYDELRSLMQNGFPPAEVA